MVLERVEARPKLAEKLLLGLGLTASKYVLHPLQFLRAEQGRGRRLEGCKIVFRNGLFLL